MSAFGGKADIDCGRQSKRLPHSFARAAPAPSERSPLCSGGAAPNAPARWI